MGGKEYRRVPVTLLQTVSLILHSLAVDQFQDGQMRNGNVTEGLAHRLDRIVIGREHQ